ncbi:MAG TPA: DUF5678 domain-containing protein [Candidatus Andersenbacteria bacterium]|nr:MAG: hypothetical protein A2854_01915 [Parcubacteria group bacterium RIFCSPHIGHO2_01_FULL_56_18]HLD25985.1 DUF5678 domain-containing protein [Candidatus Andersenbacteria bacterium]
MAKNWTKLFKKYRGQWVALETNEITVISSGATAKIAYNEALKKGHQKPILTHVPSDLLPLASIC